MLVRLLKRYNTQPNDGLIFHRKFTLMSSSVRETQPVSPAATRWPPGKPPAFIGGNLLHYRRDPLGYLTQNARDYGDVALIMFGKWPGFQINHPDDVQQVLVKQAHKFHKAIIYKATLSQYLGNGLLISDGDFWRRQRQLAQPAFHTRRIQAYADVMTAFTQQMLERWRPGETRNIAQDMMNLTLYIVAKTLFDADISGESNLVARALEVLLHSVIEQSQMIIRLPDWVPTPARQRKRWSIETLHQVTMDIIQERRAAGVDRGDLLSMLISAQTEDGERMTDDQVRDEALTIVLAGHETTANAMTWTFYLLAQHPDVEERLAAEISEALGGRPPTLADMPRLTYTEQVIKESMRLYPPAWSFARSVLEPVELGGYTLPPRSTVVILPYVIHRDERWFPQPLRFDPERFNPANEEGGPRVCIGNSFAMMEAKIILASVVQRYRLALRPGYQAEPEPLVTLRPRGGMPMQVLPR
jgi:cytochrome P450